MTARAAGTPAYMGDDFEDRILLTIGPDAAFTYLSDVQNLPGHFAALRDARLVASDRVEVTADVGGTRVEGEAWLHLDNAARRMTWGAPGPGDYRGELTVHDAGPGSEVVVRLHTEQAGGVDVQQGLRDSLQLIGERLGQA
ncbi:Polyketide cyclase / dehydrase and lipid transport [Pseudonocardia ammonioxydans]|uniref:Polyketide cyclase / dehydrase and lipid transport n=2 Tax=Pseudonocardia ammonioxydans TaxID=260086 RepID=A0A1I5DFL7_PSUAM|nr:Polyketide cyclase / dehydrase and lipid transport [Pseudonocardia ammonioxydans]